MKLDTDFMLSALYALTVGLLVVRWFTLFRLRLPADLLPVIRRLLQKGDLERSIKLSRMLPHAPIARAMAQALALWQKGVPNPADMEETFAHNLPGSSVKVFHARISRGNWLPIIPLVLFILHLAGTWLMPLPPFVVLSIAFWFTTIHGQILTAIIRGDVDLALSICRERFPLETAPAETRKPAQDPAKSPAPVPPPAAEAATPFPPAAPPPPGSAESFAPAMPPPPESPASAGKRVFCRLCGREVPVPPDVLARIESDLDVWSQVKGPCPSCGGTLFSLQENGGN